ncbi:hypothetical protein PFLUV_G00106730 [Perca fluviatilis]|uniref:Translation elongation factor EF1B beta/delta subunit guanine nucleotide exchange domain-containing protein n=1 Tax=Perca fluviatilis TaxID=8168 RepID=A0A6A5FB82_PERFL|nr:hypothetical protein PFLUV_G00106730 [Perca fluviatilis]
MMSKKIPQCSALDQSEHDQPLSHSQVDRSANALGSRNQAESGHRNGETASSSPESGSLNGDGKRSGKSRRRKKRSSNPESRSEGKVDTKTKNGEKPDKRTSQPPSDPRTGLIGLQSECASVWFDRSVYEQAESLYQCWLASSSSGTTKSKRSPPAPGNLSNTPSAAAPSSSGQVCHHGDQVACHHVVQSVWVNKTTFDQAERRFVIESVQPPIPNSLNLPSPPNRSIAPRTPDEGYQSLAPTPATPVIQQAAVTPTGRQSINGLPRIPVELLRDVWLEKPLYDRAEAAFYQNLYGNSSSKRSSCASTSRSSDHPQSLVEEEEEGEEEAEEVAVEEKHVVPQGKAEVFHALLPIQEEDEPAEDVGANSILQDIARARENIQKSLAGLKTTLCNRGSGQPSLSQQSQLSSSSAADQGEIICRIKSLELENHSLHKVVDDLRAALSKLECRVSVLEKSPAAVTPVTTPSVPYTNGTTVQQKTSAPVKDEEEDDDDDIDLFGSDDDEEADKLKEQRLKEYAEKKAKKPGIIAKSSILLDVKPWDDETDMVKLEECVRSVQADGLLWGTSKLVPVGYGIKKLQIACVVEDDKVGTDMLEEEITKFEDYIQSVDVAAFNKI